MIKIGDKVECVDDDFYSDDSKIDRIIDLFEILPKKGDEYIVRELRSQDGVSGVLLEEIVNSPKRFPQGLIEPGFNVNRFRKTATTPPKKVKIEENETV